MNNLVTGALHVALFALGFAILEPTAGLTQGIISDIHDVGTISRLDELKKRDGQDVARFEKNNKAQAFPLVIFVPGILGSKIEECDKRGSTPVNCTPIWGQKGWNLSTTNMAINPSKHYETTVLDNFKALGQEFDFYGDGLAYIFSMIISDYSSLIPFPYDWRQDNRQSALNFQDFLCNLPAVQKSRPIVIVAHSMGGLIVKYWFGRMFQQKTACADGSVLSINLQEIMFAGTPHYGSPEAIKAFAEGFRLEGGGGVFGFVKEMYSRATIEKELNKYGTMFPSVYQLLPIYAASCMADLRSKIDLPAPVATHSGGIFDLFSVNAWREVGWPKHMPEGLTPNAFYERHLPAFLKDAQDFLCATAKVEFPPSVRVAYFSSEAHDTVKTLTLEKVPLANAQASNPKKVGFAKTDTTKGDGTVPHEIAINALDLDAARHRLSPTEKHEYLLNAREFRSRVGYIYRAAQAKLMETSLADPKRRRQLQDLYLRAGASVFASLPEIQAGPSDPKMGVSVADARNLYPYTLNFNRSLMELRGLKLDELRESTTQAADLDDGGARSIALALQTIDGERFPDRPVRIVVPFAPGGATDAVGRLLAPKLADLWGVPVSIENVGGASGNIGTGRVAQAAPDGYTVLLSTNGPLTINASMFQQLPFDPVRDFAPVSLVASMPSILAVRADLPANSVRELIAIAKAQPGGLSYASNGLGSHQHLVGEFFKIQAGVNIVHVPYMGSSPAVAALQNGGVVMGFANPAEILPLVRSGQLRALAITSANRSPLAPDVPTAGEAGLANFNVSSWTGVLIPVGTPGSIVSKLNRDVARAVALPEVRERLVALGMDVVGNSSEAFAALISTDVSRWSAVAVRAGLKSN